MQNPTNKTTALATTKPSAIGALASRMQVEPEKLYKALQETVFKKATNEELLALVVVANEYGLNPFLKELYAFPAKGGGITPIVSVDGWIKMLVNHLDYDGMEFADNVNEQGELVSCTVTIHHKKRSHPTKITEYLAECRRNTEPWNTMPYRMLRNRTICQGARVAFGFSGIQSEDEYGDVPIEAFVVPPHEAAPASEPKNPANIPKKIVTDDSNTPQKELEALVISAGYNFTQLQNFCVETGQMENASSLGSFSEIPSDVAKRLVKSKVGLLAALEKIKGTA